MARPVVGIAGPLSGPRACYGEMLLEEVRAHPGLGGAELDLRDDAADAGTAASVAAGLAERRAAVVVGHFNSDCAQAAGEVYGAAGIPLLLPASTRPSLTRNPVIWRTCPDDRQQVSAMLDHLRVAGAPRIALWSDGSGYGDALHDLLAAALAPAGMAERLVGIDRLPDDGVLVCLGAHHRVAATLARLRSAGTHCRFLCCDDCSVEEFADMVRDTGGIAVARPVPGFRECIRSALDLVAGWLRDGRAGGFAAWPGIRERFVDRQLAGTAFAVGPLGAAGTMTITETRPLQ